MNLVDDARALQGDLVQLRRVLHREPEVGLDLPRTQERVLEALDGLPLEISTGTNTTSVTAVLRGGRRSIDATQTVLLRADMDGLPVTEQTGLDFAAQNGAMHGCGHDLHTAALVGAAHLLSRHRDHLAGDVVLMFQPGEEGVGRRQGHGGRGCARRRRAPRRHRLRHARLLLPEAAGGRFFSKAGTLLAASYKLTVTVRGAGGHGSSPVDCPGSDHRAGRDDHVAADDGHPDVRRVRPRRGDGRERAGRVAAQHHSRRCAVRGDGAVLFAHHVREGPGGAAPGAGGGWRPRNASRSTSPWPPSSR